jgi:hypothetical protein
MTTNEPKFADLLGRSWMTNLMHYGKGLSETDVALPAEIQHALDSRWNNLHNLERSDWGYLIEQLDFIVPFTEQAVLPGYDSSLTSSTPIPFATYSLPNMSDWHPLNENDWPNTENGPIAHWDVEIGEVGDIQQRAIYVYDSISGNYRYIASHDPLTNSVQTLHIEDLTSPINTYGVRSTHLDVAGATISRNEHLGQQFDQDQSTKDSYLNQADLVNTHPLNQLILKDISTPSTPPQ